VWYFAVEIIKDLVMTQELEIQTYLLEETSSRGQLHILDDDEASDTLYAIESLDKARDAIKLSINKEGISEREVKLIELSLEQIASKVGLYNTRFLSLENYSGSVSKRLAAKVALEGLGESIWNGIKKILEWIKNSFIWIMGYIKELMGSNKGLSDKAKKYENKARELVGKKPKNNKITDSHLVNFFCKSGKVYSPDEVIKAYKDHVGILGNAFSMGYLKSVLINLEKATMLASSGEDYLVVLKEVNNVFTDIDSRCLNKFTSRVSGSGDEISYVLKTLSLGFGQKALTASFSKDKNLYKGLTVTLEDDADKKPVSGSLETLDPSDIETLSGLVNQEMAFGSARGCDVVMDELEKIEKTVTKACNKITDNKEGKPITYSIHFLKDVVSSTISMVSIVSSFDSKLAKRTLTYLNDSIKEYAE
jgi:hypothetical protein